MTQTLQQLEKAAQQAAERHQAAQEAAEKARVKAEQDRAARLTRYDRKVLDGFDDDALGQQVRDAQQALDQAVADSRLGRAWVEMKAAQLRRAHLSNEAAAAAMRIGDPRTIATRPAGSALPEELTRAVDRVAERLVADELDAADAARQ
jgi:hypothetical protein